MTSRSPDALEKGLLISDIDDTIKRTHMRAGLRGQALVMRNAFTGMKELYDRFASHRNPVVYLSASPGRLQVIGKRFLENAGFPPGVFIGRRSVRIDKELFKAEAIVKLARENPEVEIVLTGDNGERDVNAFQRALRLLEVEGLRTDRLHPFVHQVYAPDAAGPPPSSQTAFATAGDLALHVFALGLITEQDLNDVADLVLSGLGSESLLDREAVLPWWVDCRGFMKLYRRPDVPLSPETDGKIARLEELLDAACESSGRSLRPRRRPWRRR